MKDIKLLISRYIIMTCNHDTCKTVNILITLNDQQQTWQIPYFTNKLYNTAQLFTHIFHRKYGLSHFRQFYYNFCALQNVII